MVRPPNCRLRKNISRTAELKKLTTPQPADVAVPPPPATAPTSTEGGSNTDDDRRIHDLLNAYVGAMQDRDGAEVQHLNPKITDKQLSGLTGSFHDADSIQVSHDCKHDPLLGRTEVTVTCRHTFRTRSGGVWQPPSVNTAIFTLRKIKRKGWIICKPSIS